MHSSSLVLYVAHPGRRIAPCVALALLMTACHSDIAQGQDRELIHTGGQVVEITDSTLTVETEERTLRFQTVPSTRVSLQGRSVRLDQLQAGDDVEIVTSPAEPGVALRIVAQPPAPARQAPANGERRRAQRPREEYAALGLSVSPSPTGVYVADVMPGSPAHKVGLSAGSFILSIGEVEVTQPRDLLGTLEQLQPQETIKLVAWTNGETRDMAVVLGSSAEFGDSVSTPPEDSRTPPRPETPVVLTGVSLVETDEGVTVADVAPQSPAAELGLVRGDVILGVGGVRISTTTELFEVVQSLEPGAKARVEVQRGPARAELVLVMPAESVTVRRTAPMELPPDMPEYARILLRHQQENEKLLEALLRDVEALRDEVEALRR